MGRAKKHHGRFLTPLRAEEQKGGKLWLLFAPLVFSCASHGAAGLRIVVPAGFLTDFASVPWFARWAVSRIGRHTKAAVLHDWLYHTQELSRREADALFLHAMKDLGVALWRRQLAHKAVRVAGWVAWKKRRAVL